MTALLLVVAASVARTELPNSSAYEPFLAEAAPGFVLSPAVPAEDPPPDLDIWKGSISLGATAADGNTHRKTGTATAALEKRTEQDRWNFGFLWNYAKEEGVTTQRRTLGTAEYDYFLSKKAYVLAQASGEGDLNAQLDLRMVVGVGAGYQFREDEQWKISGEAGVAWVDENYEDDDADGEFPAGRGAYKADWKPDEKWELGQAGEIIPSLENGDDVIARVDTHGRFAFTDKMFAQLQWLYTWDNTPAAGAERVDNLYLLTVGWTF